MNSIEYCSFPSKSKKAILEKDEECCNLLVYGYASKLYNDDEKALELDQGKHLIPWMGNESLKIDRYDVRGYLNDLSPFEEGETDKGVSEEEQIVEKMCDVERYHALFSNEEEEECYREEEVKRRNQLLTKEYHQVPFQYLDSSGNLETDSFKGSEYTERTDIHFNTNLLSYFPSNITLPPTNNTKEIIDKTAACVAKHGRQMEIMIKARQGNTDKFDFLNRNSKLNSYYEHILNEFKNGNNQKEVRGVCDDNIKQVSSVASFSKFVEAAPHVSTANYTATIETRCCPYSLIVDKIQNSTKYKANEFIYNEKEYPGILGKADKSET